MDAKLKLRGSKNDKLILWLKYLMIKLESDLAINNNNDKNNNAITENSTSSMPIVLWIYFCDLKKGH